MQQLLTDQQRTLAGFAGWWESTQRDRLVVLAWALLQVVVALYLSASPLAPVAAFAGGLVCGCVTVLGWLLTRRGR